MHANGLRALKKAAVTSPPFHSSPPLLHWPRHRFFFIHIPSRVPVPPVPSVLSVLVPSAIGSFSALAASRDCSSRSGRRDEKEEREQGEREPAGSQQRREEKRRPSVRLFSPLIMIQITDVSLTRSALSLRLHNPSFLLVFTLFPPPTLNFLTSRSGEMLNFVRLKSRNGAERAEHTSGLQRPLVAGAATPTCAETQQALKML